MEFQWASLELRRWRGKLFQSRTPATVKDRSPRLVRVLETSHVATLDDRSRGLPVVLRSSHSPGTAHADKTFSAF